MTPEEKEILHRLHSKSMRFMEKPNEEVDDMIHMDVYNANLALLRK